MPRLLAAEVEAALPHRLDHVAVAHRRAHEGDALRVEGALEAEVAHHGAHDGVAPQLAVPLHARRAHGHHRVAVHDPALLVDHDHPVGVAVEGDADLRPAPHHLGPRVVGVERPDLAVDVRAVRAHPDGVDPGPELGEDEGGHHVGRAVGGVDHHPQAVEGEVAGKGALDERHVAPAGVLELHRAPDGGPGAALAEERRLADERLDLGLRRVGQLEAVPAEDLDAVVVVGVVAGADHDPGVGAHAHREVGDRRRRHRPAQQHAPAHRGHPGGDRGLEHVAGEARVLADQHAGRVPLGAARDERDGAAEGERQLRGHGVDVGHPADAVGAEERPPRGHGWPFSRSRRTETSAGCVSRTLTPARPGAISTATGRRGARRPRGAAPRRAGGRPPRAPAPARRAPPPTRSRAAARGGRGGRAPRRAAPRSGASRGSRARPR